MIISSSDMDPLHNLNDSAYFVTENENSIAKYNKLTNEVVNFQLNKQNPSISIFKSSVTNQAFIINLSVTISEGGFFIDYATATAGIDYPCCTMEGGTKPGNYSFSLFVLTYVNITLPREVLANGTEIFSVNKTIGDYFLTYVLTSRAVNYGDLGQYGSIFIWIQYLFPMVLIGVLVVFVIIIKSKRKEN